MGNRQSSFDLSTLEQRSSVADKLFAGPHSPKRMRGLSVNDLPQDSDSSSPEDEHKDIEQLDENDDFGWFEDFESFAPKSDSVNCGNQQPSHRMPSLHKSLTLPTPATQPPLYILESSLETQKLWYVTAGRRPKQPDNEREYFEQLWSQNFAQSEVTYAAPLVDITNRQSPSPNSDKLRKRYRAQSSDAIDYGKAMIGKISNSDLVAGSSEPGSSVRRPDIIPKSELHGEILYRGKSNFSNAVSKSFFDNSIISLTLYMPCYRVIRSLNGSVHAEFMIVVTLGGQSPVTFGVWKRHSTFTQLAYELSEINIKSGSRNLFKNSLLSWQCVLQRKRWYKSVDQEYLMLKCFLLERFFQDVLFESETPDVLIKFLGLD